MGLHTVIAHSGVNIHTIVQRHQIGGTVITPCLSKSAYCYHSLPIKVNVLLSLPAYQSKRTGITPYPLKQVHCSLLSAYQGGRTGTTPCLLKQAHCSLLSAHQSGRTGITPCDAVHDARPDLVPRPLEIKRLLLVMYMLHNFSSSNNIYNIARYW